MKNQPQHITWLWILPMLMISLVGTAVFGLPALNATAQGQTAKVVTYDTPVSGSITDAALEETWTLNAPARDRIAIVVKRSDGTLVPELELRGPNNQPMATAQQDNTYAQAAIGSTKLPSVGPYTILVSRFKGKDGKTTGSYTLTVQLLGAGSERHELFTFKSEPLPEEVTYTSELTNAKWIDVWRFHAHGAEHVKFIVTRIDGNLIPTLYIFSATGAEVKRSDPAPEGDQAQLDFILNGNDNYELRVARKDNADGVTVGKYTVIMSVLGGSAQDELVEGVVKLATPRTGDLENRVWQNAWAFSTDQATTLTLSATRTGGTLIPGIKILDAKGQELASTQADEPFTTATIKNYAFQPGQYLIVIYRLDGINGSTTGQYQLNIAAKQ